MPETCAHTSLYAPLQVLALELLLVIVQHSGPCFQHHEVCTDPCVRLGCYVAHPCVLVPWQSFISGIKQYLCPSLLKNGVSSVPQACVRCLPLSGV